MEANETLNKNSLMKFIRGIWQKPGLFVAAVISTLIATASGILYPHMTRLLIEQMQTGIMAWTAVVWLLAVLLGGAVFSAIGAYLLRNIAQGFVRDLRIRLIDSQLHAPAAVIEQRQAADSANRIISDARIIGQFLSDQIAGAFGSVLTLLFSIAFLLTIDLVLSGILFACVLVSFMLIFPVASRMEGISKAIQESEARFMGRAAEVLLNIRLVKASTAEHEESRLFSESAGALFSENMREAKVFAVLSPIADMAISGTLVLVLAAGAYRVSMGSLEIASLVAFILYLFNVVMPVTQLSIFSAEYNKASGAAERLTEAADVQRESYSIGDSVDSLQKPLQIRNLVFAYPGNDSPVLALDQLHIDSGETIALVGLSGAGKSTLLAMISRLYEQDGLYLDGRDSREILLSDWRQRCAYVHQNSPVLSGSVYFNLCYGCDPKPDRQACEEVLRDLKLWDMLDAKDGLDTYIGEQGGNVSGGQRQRLSVARAMLRNPDILLLDEATSALDSQTEKDIQNALLPLMRNCTTLIAAHRLNTVMNADRIILLHEGRIVASGRHQELLQTSSEYELLVREQLQPAGLINQEGTPAPAVEQYS